MLSNNFKMAIRHLWRSRLYACLNVVGLAMGMACMLLAMLFALDENSFDNFHQQNLYRINSRVTSDGKSDVSGGTGQVQGPAFKLQVSEVSGFARIMGGAIYEDVRAGDKALRLQLLFADDTFFDVFNFKVRLGDSKSALKNVNSVVITEKTALEFFGRLDVVGQLLEMNYEPSARRIGEPLIVSAVVQDPPANSSIQFDILFPFKFLQVSFDDTSWLNSYLGTFVVLHPTANMEAVVQKFNAIHRIHAQEQLAESKRSDGKVPHITYELQHITDIHLNPNGVSGKTGEDGVVNGSKPIYTYLLLGIATFILFMGSINFININIADSLKRAKEIGVRKVTGGNQVQIMVQFLGESAFLCGIAYLFSLGLTLMVLPVFNQLSGKQLHFSELWSASFLLYSTIVFLVNVLVSGLYPAFLLSRYNPVQILYHRQKGSRPGLLSNGLVTFQFSIAVLLGICTLIFYQQMQYIGTKDLGYDPSQVVKMKIPALADTRHMATYFKNELKNDVRIGGLSVTGEFGTHDTKANNRVVESDYLSIDADYLTVMGIQVKKGRGFSPLFAGNSARGIVVNEAFVRAAALKEPIGAQVRTDTRFGTEAFSIVGVVKNFHHGSFREKIRPMIMIDSEQYGGDAIMTKVDASVQKEILAQLEGVYHKLLPGAVFDFSFLDEQNAGEYREERRWQLIVGYATGLSIFICSLGLFALTHLSAAQRTRETGIRIVLGATLGDIVNLFCKGFLQMVFLVVLIASPLAYFILDNWLSGFAYRITIHWLVFVLTGGLAVLVALLVVGYLAVKAGLINPVQALRSE